jgi:hypothetical protein
MSSVVPFRLMHRRLIYINTTAVYSHIPVNRAPLALILDHSIASSFPFLAVTLRRTGTGTASMMRRKTNPFRIFPVISEMRPTMAGPTNEADLSVRANKEKKDDS